MPINLMDARTPVYPLVLGQSNCLASYAVLWDLAILLLVIPLGIDCYSVRDGFDLFIVFISREVFNKWQAQRWWAENYDKVMELYNVQRFNHQAVPLPTPPRSEDEVRFLSTSVHSLLTFTCISFTGVNPNELKFSFCHASTCMNKTCGS